MAEPLPDVADSVAKDVQLLECNREHGEVTEVHYDSSLRLYSETAASDPSAYSASVGPSAVYTEGTRHLPPGTWW